MSDIEHNEPTWMASAAGVKTDLLAYFASNQDRRKKALDIGAELNRAREKVPHGEWGEYLKAAGFKVTKGKNTTATKWMELAEWGASISPHCGGLSEGAVVLTHPDTGEEVRGKGLNDAHDKVKKTMRMASAGERKAEREARQRAEGIDLRVRGIEDLINDLDAESVHAIVTDPPYEESAIGLFGALGALAAKVLVPGGQLAVLSGKIFLPKVIAELEAVDGIQYRWVFSWRMDGGAFSRIMAANAIQAWKPVIIYRKPPKDKNREPFAKDTFDSEQLEPQREHHKWGQQTLATYRMLERFAWPGDTVLDPFLGGGTTAVCAKARGCNFIGADIDESCIITTQERIDKENPC